MQHRIQSVGTSNEKMHPQSITDLILFCYFEGGENDGKDIEI